MEQTATFFFPDGIRQSVIRTMTVHMTVHPAPGAGRIPASPAPDFPVLAGGVKASAARQAMERAE